jgi:hypothetical protein
MKRKFFLFFAFILLWEMAFADEKKEVASQWRGPEMKIDGADGEWPEAITYLEKEKFGFGVKNDSSHLYLCLKFDREIQRQAMIFGFTIWFDPAGKNKKTFGVRFPIGMVNFDSEFMPDPMQPMEEGDVMSPQFAAMLREIEVLGPDKDDRNRFSASSAFGIQTATAESPNGLVCELKIPLRISPGQPYAIAANMGQMMSVGFEMGELDRGKMRERMGREGGPFGGGMPPGGLPPGGGVRGGRPPGGMPGGGRPGAMNMPKAFKIWRNVTLATNAPLSQGNKSGQNN